MGCRTESRNVRTKTRYPAPWKKIRLGGPTPGGVRRVQRGKKIQGGGSCYYVTYCYTRKYLSVTMINRHFSTFVACCYICYICYTKNMQGLTFTHVLSTCPQWGHFVSPEAAPGGSPEPVHPCQSLYIVCITKTPPLYSGVLRRSGGIRTRGLLVPNQTRYQTALHLEKTSQQRDSNPRPAVYETAALPTEPCWHG